MAFVTIDEGDLARERPKSIREFLAPLALNDIACNATRSPVEGGRVFATHDGNIAGREYRDWRFSSRHRDVRCSYFELWKPSERSRLWFLDRGYLTLFLIDRVLHKEYELLCVHSDPNNNDGEPMRGFKKGPHLHVKRLEEGLTHSHFPLTVGYIDRAIHSTAELTRLYGEVATLLSIEVLDRL